MRLRACRCRRTPWPRQNAGGFAPRRGARRHPPPMPPAPSYNGRRERTIAPRRDCRNRPRFAATAGWPVRWRFALRPNALFPSTIIRGCCGRWQSRDWLQSPGGTFPLPHRSGRAPQALRPSCREPPGHRPSARSPVDTTWRPLRIGPAPRAHDRDCCGSAPSPAGATGCTRNAQWPRLSSRPGGRPEPSCTGRARCRCDRLARNAPEVDAVLQGGSRPRIFPRGRSNNRGSARRRPRRGWPRHIGPARD